MTDKIGFVNMDNQDQQEPIMGRTEGQNDSRREFPRSLWGACLAERDPGISDGVQKRVT